MLDASGSEMGPVPLYVSEEGSPLEPAPPQPTDQFLLRSMPEPPAEKFMFFLCIPPPPGLVVSL